MSSEFESILPPPSAEVPPAGSAVDAENTTNPSEANDAKPEASQPVEETHALVSVMKNRAVEEQSIPRLTLVGLALIAITGVSGAFFLYGKLSELEARQNRAEEQQSKNVASVIETIKLEDRKVNVLGGNWQSVQEEVEGIRNETQNSLAAQKQTLVAINARLADLNSQMSTPKVVTSTPIANLPLIVGTVEKPPQAESRPVVTEAHEPPPLIAPPTPNFGEIHVSMSAEQRALMEEFRKVKQAAAHFNAMGEIDSFSMMRMVNGRLSARKVVPVKKLDEYSFEVRDITDPNRIETAYVMRSGEWATVAH